MENTTYRITLTDLTNIILANGERYTERYTLHQGITDYLAAWKSAQTLSRAYGSMGGFRVDEVRVPGPKWGQDGLTTVGYDCFKENHPRHIICLGEPYQAELKRQIRIEEE